MPLSGHGSAVIRSCQRNGAAKIAVIGMRGARLGLSRRAPTARVHHPEPADGRLLGRHSGGRRSPRPALDGTTTGGRLGDRRPMTTTITGAGAATLTLAGQGRAISRRQPSAQDCWSVPPFRAAGGAAEP
jgi:hypothetical protein